MRVALRDLLLGAAAEAGGGFANLAEARDAIRTLWRLEIELDELREIVAGLIDEGACEKNGGGVRLANEQHERLEAQAAEFNRNEEQAFGDWVAAIRRMEPDLTEDDFSALREDLDLWLQHVISRHGVEAALILYPENPRAQELQSEIEAEGFDFLPRRSRTIRGIRGQALQMFAQQPTAEQRLYLASLLNVSYFLTVLSLDPSATELVQAHVQGHRIYLDTNILYHVLGLTKPREVLSVRRLLDLTKQLEFELAITPWTLRELQESLRRAEQVVRRRALPPRELADLMAEAASEESFVTAYWRHYNEGGIKPSDFFEFYSALETLLEEVGIKVISEGTQRVDQQTEQIDYQLVMLDRVLTWDKADVVKIHDVKHRLLIDNLRGSGNLSFSNARYWFLTQDSALPRYAQISADDDSQGHLQFCISTSAWAQIVRSLTPRTEDVDQALVDLLASPYMRYRGSISPQIVQDVVARIDQYKGMSPGLASEVLLNGALVRDFSRTENADERVEKIDHAIVAGAERLHVQLEHLTERETEQREKLREVEAEKTSSLKELAKAHERIAEIEEASGAEKQELKRRLDESEQKVRQSESQATERTREAEKQRQELEDRVTKHQVELEKLGADVALQTTILRAIGSTACGLLGIGAALLIVFGVVDRAWPIVGVSIGVIGCVLLGVASALGWSKGVKAGSAVAILVGLVASLFSVVDELLK